MMQSLIILFKYDLVIPQFFLVMFHLKDYLSLYSTKEAGVSCFIYIDI